MIDLTPLEVRKKKGDFRRAMRGYDPALVDDFLDLVADRLDELVRENMALTERVTRQDQQVADYRERERALTEALVTAQEMREEIRRQSAQEADLARRTAEQAASQLRTAAQQETTQLRAAAAQEASQLRSAAQQEAAQLKARVQQEVAELRSALRQEREREEESLRILRARQQQFVTAYRSFLEQELNELGAITRGLGLARQDREAGEGGEGGAGAADTAGGSVGGAGGVHAGGAVRAGGGAGGLTAQHGGVSGGAASSMTAGGGAPGAVAGGAAGLAALTFTTGPLAPGEGTPSAQSPAKTPVEPLPAQPPVPAQPPLPGSIQSIFDELEGPMPGRAGSDESEASDVDEFEEMAFEETALLGGESAEDEPWGAGGDEPVADEFEGAQFEVEPFAPEPFEPETGWEDPLEPWAEAASGAEGDAAGDVPSDGPSDAPSDAPAPEDVRVEPAAAADSATAGSGTGEVGETGEDGEDGEDDDLGLSPLWAAAGPEPDSGEAAPPEADAAAGEHEAAAPLELYDLTGLDTSGADEPGPIGLGSTAWPEQPSWTVEGLELAPEGSTVDDMSGAADRVSGGAADDDVADDDDLDEDVTQLLRNAAAAGYVIDDLDVPEELLLDDELGLDDSVADADRDEDEDEEGDGWLPSLLRDDR
jgi:cell division initiation protein